ncbi:PREDICTED: uncharacterized protein LOC101306139 [Fragaria vesca subsp. vesca]|uniref:uncharacterized protein LOC101306139 n=1 Tax=Fragaria vesca subsp. vesca TaxID=101020 RepID=UPI0002C3353E|nr:PREDICTED: uncharacterized protein LOC101306139 [Fragaria vesca subsp. vesca]
MDHVATSTPSDVENEYTRDKTSQFTTTQTFESKEELIKWAKEVGRSNDITVVVLRSDKKKPRVTLGCEKSGKYDTRYTREKPMTDKKGRRNTGTKKSDCPFRLTGKKLPAGDEWELTVVEGKHNHEAKDTIRKQGHSFQGRLSQEEKSLVKDWRETGKQPKEILEDLKKRDTHNKSTARTILNECQRLERLEDKRCQLQQLASRPEKHNFIEKHRRTSPKMDTASDLFLTHRISLELLLAFPTVLEIHWQERPPSSTRFIILGITSTDTIFFVAFAITSRDGSSYEWALSSLRGVMNGYGIAMPDVVILETWADTIQLAPMKKVVNDVFSTAKVLLSMAIVRDWLHAIIYGPLDDYYSPYTLVIPKLNYEERISFRKKWKLLVESPTEADLEQRIMQLRTEFCKYPKILDYVTDTLLEPYKEMFVAAWTDKVMHLGWSQGTWGCRYSFNLASILSNRLAGVEQKVPTDKFWKDLQGWIENDNVNVKQSLKSENYDGYGFPELKGLYGTVSRRALTLLREQTDVARRRDVDNGENCRCAIRSTHGLPCAHQIAKYRREGRPIPPECINSHWRTLQLKPLRETGEPSVEGRVKRRKLSDKKNTDTHFVLPLPDDIVESERNSPNAGPSIVPSTQDRQPDDEVSDIQSTNKLLELVNVSPLVLRPYVLDVKDVPRDGHCGFSTIASLLGITDEDGRPGWVKVREDLRKELKFHRDHYAHLFGSKHEVDDLLHRLDYSLIPCPEKEHWMIMPEMGHIIASCYGVVLILLSSVQNQCFTFFPLQTAPTFVSLPAEIAIGFCDEHFVQVLFKENHRYPHPMPPPAALLTKREPSDFDRHQQQRSREWATRYDARMKQFSSYLQPMVVSHENPIVLDTVSSMDIF